MGVLYPLVPISPKDVVWIESRRVYRFYSELRLLEAELASASSRRADEDLNPSDWTGWKTGSATCQGTTVPQTAAVSSAVAYQKWFARSIRK